jgi:hypothetical protein
MNRTEIAFFSRLPFAGTSRIGNRYYAPRAIARASALLSLATAFGLFVSPVAQAATITVSANGLTGSWTSPTTDGSWGSLTSPNIPIDATGTNTVLAEIALSDTSETDPTAAVAFGFVAGATPTTFTISSALVSFPAVINPNGTASAAMTVTSFDGGGATVTGNYAGPESFQALYNGANVFTSLIPGVATGPNSSNSVSAGPVVGVVPGAISSIQSVFSFTLSANDLASGTGRFSVPEPGTFVLLGLGMVALLAAARAKR